MGGVWGNWEEKGTEKGLVGWRLEPRDEDMGGERGVWGEVKGEDNDCG